MLKKIKIPSGLHTLTFKAQKYNTELLIGSGIVLGISATLSACRATTKASKIIEQSKEDLATIQELKESEKYEDYTEEDAKKDTVIVYKNLTIDIVRLYFPAVLLSGLSIATILTAYNLIKKRNIALGAAYATIDKAYKDYRRRVVDKYGEDVDREMRHGLKPAKFEEKVVDEETGKEKKVKKNGFVVNPSDVSGYARFFEKYTTDEDGNVKINENWKPNNEMNIFCLKTIERYANDLLKIKKRVFLNEVYEMLDLPKSQAGQVVGWVYDEENPKGDNYIDFGLYSDNLSYSDYINGFEPAILLDFNVDGYILDTMRKK